MAMTISAGVQWREIDLSNYIPALSTTSYAVVGTATKGPINERTFIGSTEQFIKTFGYPSSLHLATYAALEYLKEGNQLWFVRVESAANPCAVATTSIPLIDGGSINQDAKNEGTFYNNTKIKIDYSNSRNIVETKLGSQGTLGTFTFTTTAPGVANSYKVYLNDTLVATDDGSGVFVEEVGDTIEGTVNYKTGAISLTFDTPPDGEDVVKIEGLYYSTFNVVILKNILDREYTIESYKNLSLDSTKENYYYNILTRSDILKNVEYTAFPEVGTYELAGGSDGLDNIVDADFIGQVVGNTATGLQLFANSEEVDINTASIPGRSSSAITQALITLAEVQRRDCMVLIDPPYGITPETVVDWADGSGEYAALNSINSSYAAIYYPWVQIYDSYNRSHVMIPPSGFVGAAFARTDKVSDIFYPPAGINRGKLVGSTSTELVLNEGQRVLLYLNRINPISDFIATGIVIWGQKTAQIATTDLDRVAARRTLLYLEKIIVTALQPLVFEPNNKYTWARAVAIVQPVLDSMVNKGGLYYGKIVCDEKVNTPDVVARNEMVANIFLKLPKSAEIITLNFVLLATGANVEEYLGRQF